MAKSRKAPRSAGGSRIDEPTGVETVGHEWDGIEELNNPLPRWWAWTFYLTILFAIGYMVVYPAVPLLSQGTEGIWGWSSRGQLAEETSAANSARAATLAAIEATPIEQLSQKPVLMQQAVAGGRAAFMVNCVQCHGAGAAGSKGYPNLNDDDWLWGGSLPDIEKTLQRHGITPAMLRSDFANVKPYEITSFQKLHGDLGSMPEEIAADAQRLYVYDSCGDGEDVGSLLTEFVDRNRTALLAEVERITGDT